jgi:starch phosphorylase
LSLRHATMINAVSKLHAHRANEIWTNHPMLSITNGIHIPTWDKMANLTDGNSWWQQHLERKKVLLAHIKEETGNDWQANQLLIGWARRIVNYKRPLALFEDLAAFKSIAQNSERPVKIVFAGLPHPDDRIGVEMLNQILRMAAGELNGTVVYLKDYTIDLGAMLTSGCDVWLNTPIVGYEACGTSGMKASLNGTLPMTTPDGWAAEVNLDEIGWALASENIKDSLLSTLRDKIVPGYYNRDTNGLPAEWINKSLKARQLILDSFSATRMLKQYVDNMYVRILDNQTQPSVTV